ncbi:polymorphic toxin type 27 domain-containing protein [Streptomyces sp. NBC_01619]|uniref:polymorphic toxin type 27 domain-containing protein n=1 Tax=Streptomyces sp. NBC_01619 TaxID=2975901 RepID=UPI002258B578|nr:polymorphic toxin type 27 domain-containing protein [Streptomyces sp. NBC_01619]MCX4515114.1 polymorphic toxin type 27 domain-containing protein [Streptomyces sp. NBC_01619]
MEGGAPVWMTNVMEAIQDRNSTLSITLDGMPHRGGETGNWNTPETIVAAFQHAVAEGSPYSTKDGNRPPDGLGTAWEMSQVAYYVRKYEMDVADGYPENLRDGRPWEEIRWYSRDDANGGFREIKIPKPDIPEIQVPNLNGK